MLESRLQPRGSEKIFRVLFLIIFRVPRHSIEIGVAFASTGFVYKNRDLFTLRESREWPLCKAQ